MAEQTRLSAECEAELRTWEMAPVYSDSAQDFVLIYDCDGNHVVTVSPAISAPDLRALLRHGKRRYEEGRTFGRLELSYQLRQLINAAPLES